MAAVLHTTVSNLRQWERRQRIPLSEPSVIGRPRVIPEGARQHIRRCYTDHFGQWGPRTLAHWCQRTKLGTWCATTIAEVIADLVPEPEPKPEPIRYEITASQVMWSEDGAGFRERGKKKELLLLQDEHARFKVNHKLVGGPACGENVVTYLREAFDQYGAPLVLKHDGDAIFHTDEVRSLLDEYGVLDLTSPPGYPPYNGKKERSVRDVKGFVRARVRYGVPGTLADHIDAAIGDLNDDRPRPVLGGRTAREVFTQDRIKLPNRQQLREEVDAEEQKLFAMARSRSEEQSARRRATEEVLLRYSLMEIKGDVSRKCEAENATS